MNSPKPSPAVRLLKWLADAVYLHRGWFFWPQVGLAGACIWFTFAKLEFRTDRNSLVGGEKAYHKVFLEFRKALLFVPESDLAKMRQTMQEFQPFLQQFARATNLYSMLDLVNDQIRTAREETNAQNIALIQALPALRRIIDQASDALQRAGAPPSPGIDALFGGGAEAEGKLYITYDRGRIYLATAQPALPAKRAEALEQLRQLVAETQLEVPGLNVGVTGELVLEVDEMTQSQKDSMLATVLSLIGVALIFIYGYHGTGRPLKATLCLLVGIAYTMGFTTLVVGHLNILTITFV